MTLHLLSLPLEIRCQIFSYLLVSPSRFVTTLPPGPWKFSILPWDMRQEITLESQTGLRNLDMSLLRVSKQLNSECRDILWGRNTVVYTPFEVYRHTEHVLQGLGPLVAARRVAMNIDMTIGRSDVKTVAGALKALGKWSKSGSLEEVTIIVVNERRKPFEERDPQIEQRMVYKTSLERIIRFKTGNLMENLPGVPASEAPSQAKRCFEGQLSALRDARNDCLAHLKRKMIVNTNFGRLSAQGQQKYLREAFMDPNKLMKELNEALGGELWIDGKLCFRNGEQVMNAFQTYQGNGYQDSRETERTYLGINTEDPGLSKTTTTADTSIRNPLGRTVPWGQLLEQQASVLDLVE